MNPVQYELLEKIKCWKRYTNGKFPGPACEKCSYAHDICQGINMIYLKGFQDGLGKLGPIAASNPHLFKPKVIG